jgi:hypothetical protein
MTPVQTSKSAANLASFWNCADASDEGCRSLVAPGRVGTAPTQQISTRSLQRVGFTEELGRREPIPGSCRLHGNDLSKGHSSRFGRSPQHGIRWCLFRELTAQVGEKDECPRLDALFPKPSEAWPKVGPAAACRVE